MNLDRFEVPGVDIEFFRSNVSERVVFVLPEIHLPTQVCMDALRLDHELCRHTTEIHRRLYVAAMHILTHHSIEAIVQEGPLRGNWNMWTDVSAPAPNIYRFLPPSLQTFYDTLTQASPDFDLTTRRERLDPLAGKLPFLALVQANYLSLPESPQVRSVEPPPLYTLRMQKMQEVDGKMSAGTPISLSDIEDYRNFSHADLHPYIVRALTSIWQGNIILNYGTAHTWDLSERIAASVGHAVLLHFDDLLKAFYEERGLPLLFSETNEALYKPHLKTRQLQQYHSG